MQTGWSGWSIRGEKDRFTGIETCYDVFFKDGGSNKKTEGQAGGGRTEDAMILSEIEKNRQD